VKNLIVLCSILLIVACQPSAEENQLSEGETVPASTVEKSSNKKNFSLLVDQPYDVIESAQTCDQPIVIEFFAYQCPHCYTLQKQADIWKKKNQGKVKFKAVPTHLGHQEFSSFLIVHQAAEKLGVIDDAMPKIFARLHEEKRGFASQDEVVEFFVSLGVANEAARSAIQDGKAIQSEIDKNFEMLTSYKIAAVPTILVNYKYQFSVTKAGGYDRVFKVVDETLKLPSNCNAN